jgi:hypothetical protein
LGELIFNFSLSLLTNLLLNEDFSLLPENLIKKIIEITNIKNGPYQSKNVLFFSGGLYRT